MLQHQQAEPAASLRVVVLGSGGFLGRELVGLLRARGRSALAVPRSELDLCDPNAADRLRSILQPRDAVVVAAALTPDRGRDVSTLMTNLRMAECLAGVLPESPVAHVVYISSDAVYDGRESPISEDTPAAACDLYSLMHVARERIIGHAAQTGKIPYCVLRPVAIFGAGDSHNSYGPNRFMRTALKDKRIQLFGGGEEKRDHVYIADVLDVVASVLEHRSTGVLNVASGRAVSFHALAELIGRLAGSEVRIESLPRSGPITHRHFDATAIARCLPAHQPTSLEVGLRQSLDALAAGAGR